MDTASEEEDFEEWLAYGGAKRATRRGREPSKRAKTEGGDYGSGRTESPIDWRTGRRNRRYACNTVFRYDPQCPRKKKRYSGAPFPLKTSKKSSGKPFSSIAMETPGDVGSPPKSTPAGPARSQEQSFSAAIDAGGQFSATQSESVAVLETGATANLVCYKWLDTHNLFSKRQGLEEAVSYPSNAGFKLGDGRIGEVKHAADIRVGIAGCKGAFAAFVLGAAIPAFLSKGASEAWGAQLDFEKDTLSRVRRGVRATWSSRDVEFA